MIFKAPPRSSVTVLTRLISSYKIWHEYYKEFPKADKYSIGMKIDNLFIETIESISMAVFLQKEKKIPYIKRAILKLDSVKIFLEVAWEINAIDDNKYIRISETIVEPGKMLGGWYNQLVKQTPAQLNK
jgi:hypothetical protein